MIKMVNCMFCVFYHNKKIRTVPVLMLCEHLRRVLGESEAWVLEGQILELQVLQNREAARQLPFDLYNKSTGGWGRWAESVYRWFGGLAVSGVLHPKWLPTHTVPSAATSPSPPPGPYCYWFLPSMCNARVALHLKNRLSISIWQYETLCWVCIS